MQYSDPLLLSLFFVSIVISFVLLFFCIRLLIYLFFDKVLHSLNTYISDLWISYSIKEVSHLLTVNGLKAEEISKLREQFIREVYSSFSRKYKLFLLIYLSKSGLLSYIGKAFDKRMLPLLSTSTSATTKKTEE